MHRRSNSTHRDKRTALAVSIALSLFPLVCLTTRCGNSFWDQGKENVVRTLVDAPLVAGDYVIFWDGKDGKKQILPAGTYWCRLRTLEFEHRIEMKGTSGGRGIPADSSAYIPTNPLHFSLNQNFPNPFFMSDGTNIPFSVPYTVHIQLTVRNKE